MDDRLKEVLSAMLDDEADEFSIQRVMRQAESGQVQDQWRRWQQLRALMHDEERPFAQVDVSRAVWRSLEGREDGGRPPRLRRTVSSIRRNSPWAAAAMILLAMGIGFGAGFQWHGGPDDGIADMRPFAAADAGDAVNLNADRGHMVSAAETRDEAVPSIVLSELDRAQRDQLSNYLLRHAQHNSIGSGRSAVGFARVASISYGH